MTSDDASAAIHDASFPELDDAGCQRALAILVDVGTAIALELKTPDQKASIAVRAAAFDRVAKAVRRCILLSRDIAARPVQAASGDARRDLTRREIIRSVEDVIARVADPVDVGALRVELVERVESPDFELDLAHRSPAEIVKELCSDLGVRLDLAGRRVGLRRTPDDVAILNAQAAAPPGSGLARWAAQAILQPGNNHRQ